MLLRSVNISKKYNMRRANFPKNANIDKYDLGDKVKHNVLSIRFASPLDFPVSYS